MQGRLHNEAGHAPITMSVMDTSLLFPQLDSKSQTVVPRLGALIELSLQLAVERDPQRLMARFCAAARELVGAQASVIGLVDKTRGQVVYNYTSGSSLDAGSSLAPAPIPAEWWNGERRMLRLKDPQGVQRAGLPEGYPAATSLVCAPIASPQRVYGWIYLSNKTGAEEFSREDEGLLQVLAEQVGRNFENSLLYGEVTRSLAKLEDEMAERQRAEQQMLLQAAALRTAANAIIITDRNGSVQYSNPAFTALTGYSREEVLGKNPRILKSGKQGREFYSAMWAAILNGQIWHGEFTNRRKDGTLYHDEHTIAPVRSEGGEITHFVAVMQDITGRKRAEEEIRNLNEQLERRVRERTSQLEAANRELEAFSYSVSHDLSAPLRHIAGFVRLLREDLGPSLAEDPLHCLKQIEDSARRMRQLIDDLLDFSRTARAEMRLSRVPVQTLVEEVRRDLQSEVGARHVVWKTQPLPEVNADPTLLRQVFVNLMSNAIKYTRPRDPAIIEIGASVEKSGETVFYVRDNGVGFDMQYAGKLFGVFQRLHFAEDFEGTGIGLANVQRVINRHGGRAWAEGKVDGGATFYFSLPDTLSDSVH